MATLTIRNVDETTKRMLRHRAVRHGVSMEQEVRMILDRTVRSDSVPATEPGREESLYEAIRRLVEPHGGFDLDIPERLPAREPPGFE